jgi:adenosylcobinamide-phosphate synthase
LTALILVPASRISGNNAWRALEIARRDHAKTASPNAGYPMSAMAGALNVRLEKVGHYRLNENGKLPKPSDIRRAAKIVSVGLALSLVLNALLQSLNRKSRT